MFKPFILFNPGFNYVSEQVTFPVYEDFSRSPIKSRIIILYGNTGWRDYLHSCMFDAAGFQQMFVDGAPHEVAGYLKTGYASNMLKVLADLLADPLRDFTPDTLRQHVPVAWTDLRLREEHRFAVEFSGRFAFHRELSDPRPIPPPPPFPLLSERRPALQSSICGWSIGASAPRSRNSRVQPDR